MNIGTVRSVDAKTVYYEVGGTLYPVEYGRFCEFHERVAATPEERV